MIVLDASVLIAHLDDRDAHHARAEDLLAGSEDEPLGASPITFAEVLVGPTRAGVADVAVRSLELLGVGRIDVVPDAPEHLARWRAETTLTMPDCCVLLAARTATGALATFDDRLATEARRLGFQVHG